MMISTLIVGLTLILVGCFVLVYLLRPEWRAKIEQPKHQFKQQISRYDDKMRGVNSPNEFNEHDE